MKTYDISIIVPVYNSELYIHDCIKSILNQTKNNIELILVDDGSNDSSKDIILSYAEHFDNVRVVDNIKKGVINARITGLENASGKYVGWVDSDDFIEPTMFQRLYDLLIENNALVAYCDYSYYPHKVKGKEKWFKEYLGEKDWNFFERNTQCWNKLVSREYLDEIKIIELYNTLDEYANLAVLLKTDRIVFTTDQLYHYRVGIQSISGGSYKGKTDRFVHFTECASRVKGVLLGDVESELAEYFQYRYIYSLLQVLVVSAINNNIHEYQNANKKLRLLKFRKNKFTKQILNNNHGIVKSIVLRNILPLGYWVAKVITSIIY